MSDEEVVINLALQLGDQDWVWEGPAQPATGDGSGPQLDPCRTHDDSAEGAKSLKALVGPSGLEPETSTVSR